VHGTHHVYEPAADRWHEALELPTPRAKAAAATLGDRVHVVGGHGAHRRGEAHEAHVAHESFDLETGSWRAEPALPEARPVIASTAHNGRHVVVVGGERARHGGHAGADVHEYDPASRTWKRRPGVPATLGHPIVVSHNRRLLAFGTRADGGVEIHELT
jgi:N-acetylneuraminic acid mutarotase